MGSFLLALFLNMSSVPSIAKLCGVSVTFFTMAAAFLSSRSFFLVFLLIPTWCLSFPMSISSSLLSSSAASSRSLSPPRKKRTPPIMTFSFSDRDASFMISTALASVQICLFQSSRVIFTAHSPFGEVRSDVRRLKRTVCMVLLRRWFVVFALDERRSERILENSKARKVLLGVETRMGKSVFSSLDKRQSCYLSRAARKRVMVPYRGESITSLFRRSTKLPTSLSRNSDSSSAWCVVRRLIRSSGRVAVNLG